MSFDVWTADSTDWLAHWSAWPEREPHAHPAYASLYEGTGTRALCAAWRSDAGCVLYAFLLRAYKGIDVLVRALGEIPGARLVVAGDPLDPIEPLQELARALGVHERIEWRLGFLPDSEVDELMRETTVVVLPYRRTDASGVLATAIGHGRPVVVTDVGALGETVRDFDLGEVVPPGDAQALAAACVRLLEPGRLAAAFEGTRSARQALTWDAAAIEHEHVYEDVLSGRS